MTLPAAVDPDILQSIPHRPPFLFLHRIESLKPGESLIAWMNNDPNAAHYQGHYPGMPITPGALIMEALAQASCYLFVKTTHPPQGSKYYLGNVKIRFLNASGPNDSIRLEIVNKKIISTGAIFDVSAKSGDLELATGELGFICKPAGVK